jgi:hypothetical protein
MQMTWYLSGHAKYTRKLTTVFIGLIVLEGRLPLFAEDGTSRPVQVASTDRVRFAPGGVIRLTTSSANLVVQAWDRPEIEITTIKSTRHAYEAVQHDQAVQCLERISTVTKRVSDAEVAISTVLPSRSIFKHPLGGKCGAAVERDVSVPRDSRLVIHHGAGYVLISRVNGDIEVTSRSGDIVLMLPDRPGPYSIDAKSKFGDVSSDFAGASRRKSLLGQQFASASPPQSRRIHLRIGFGGITIKEVPSTPEAPVAASAQ